MKNDETNVEWWNSWAPYWAEIEDRHLNPTVIDRLQETIESPVLIIGAGQGLIGEHLTKLGHTVVGIDSAKGMIAGAKKRRGIDLICADGAALPFSSGYFRTVFIVSGVLDSIFDTEVVRSIVSEGKRCLSWDGQLYAAFSKVDPVMHDNYKRLGFVSDGKYYLGRMFELAKNKNPFSCIGMISKWSDNSYFKTIFNLVKFMMTMPPKFKEEKRIIDSVLKKAASEGKDLRKLCDTVPEVLPYRDETDIYNLFDEIGVCVDELSTHDDCYLMWHDNFTIYDGIQLDKKVVR